MKQLIQFGIGLLALSVMAGAANAGSLAPARDAVAPAGNEMIVMTHGVHSVCALGPGGWHRTPAPGVRTACRPKHPGAGYVWQCVGPECGWWHPRHRHHHHLHFPNLYIQIR